MLAGHNLHFIFRIEVTKPGLIQSYKS